LLIVVGVEKLEGSKVGIRRSAGLRFPDIPATPALAKDRQARQGYEMSNLNGLAAEHCNLLF
jgi:hypothetical protein